MRQFILKENVLTDNILFLADNGKVFKGNYVAIIEEYVFQSEWSDRQIIRRFRSEEKLMEYLDKKYPAFEIY